MNNNWMIYGANGYTANLIINEAVKQGLSPVIAGRNKSKIAKVAAKFNLPYRVFNAEYADEVLRNMMDIDLILNTSSAYDKTSEPIVQACLTNGTHYIDLCGEIMVQRKLESYNKVAVNRGITILQNAGLHSIITDCFANYVSSFIENPKELNFYLLDATRPSPGTLRSSLECFAIGGLLMRNNILVESKMGSEIQTITFKGRREILIASPMAEIFQSHKSTGISNITAYLKLPKLYYYLFLFLGEPIRNLMNTNFKNTILNFTDKIVKGPSARMNAGKKSLIGVNIQNDRGESMLMWIETPEAYYFTGILCIEAIKKVLTGIQSGVLTPHQAFGSEFITKFNNVEIYDKNLNPCSFIYS